MFAPLPFNINPEKPAQMAFQAIQATHIFQKYPINPVQIETKTERTKIKTKHIRHKNFLSMQYKMIKVNVCVAIIQHQLVAANPIIRVFLYKKKLEV